MANLTRICLTGPESTGKTEIAALLARELDTVWVPEFAREYTEKHGNDLTAADVEPIARGQIANEDRLAPRANRVLILDTDLISTAVYARYYYGSCPAWIDEEAWRRRADLYVLLDTDLAWKPDPARSAASADEREDLVDAFRAALEELGVPWEIVSGEWEERIARIRELTRQCALLQ
jgi:NadR type nicotinamide-nucleotide adenylyltransferase